ncbi:MAG: ABC transporter ATP-binding protein [Chlamydiia bacterium]|nr:ABC transporter ATP-binding protein [Chlamydiia bacterium]
MILQAKHLTKTFRYPKKFSVLQDISLDVAPGEAIAICGRSGEGKTTLLHILGTLEEADAGRLTIADQLVTPANVHTIRNQHLGFIFQAFNLLEDFTALENVAMPSRIARKPLPLSAAEELLKQVDLQDRAHFPAKLLSGGEKQRLAIARALCNNPDLILADEPFGNLDAGNASAIAALLLKLVKEKNKSLILVTHDPDLARLCDRTLFLCKGKLDEKPI